MTVAPWYAAGLHFTCRRCGSCCTGEPGYVFLRWGDADAIAAFLGLERAAFFALHTRAVLGGTSLLEETDGRCEFWDEGCRIYAVRPRQCRTYPFWPRVLASPEAWRSEGERCPGLGSGERHTAEAIDEARFPPGSARAFPA